MKKVTNILSSIFSIGIICTLISGVLLFTGYIIALIIGGEKATEICRFIFNDCTPWVIKITTIVIGIGLITMYLSKQSALTMAKSKEKKKKK